MKKNILHLGAGPLMVHSIKKIMETGAKVYCADRNEKSPGFKFCDGFEPVDIADHNETLKYAKKIKADAVIAVNDAGVYTAAYVSNELNLINLSVQTAMNCTDKGLMRNKWSEFDLPQPEYLVVEDAAALKQAIFKLGFPVIVKPCLNWGSKGVYTIHDEQDIGNGIDFLLMHNRNNRFIIEKLLPGTEMTIEAIAQEGHVEILAKSDKVRQEHRNYCVAMELNYPAFFDSSVLDRVDEIVRKAAAALGIVNGAIHTECMVNEKGIFLIEMAGRPGGGHIFGQIAEACSGVNFPVALAKIFCGEPVDIKPAYQKGVSYKFFAPPEGIFLGIEGIENAREDPHVLDIGFDMKPGTHVSNIKDDSARPGFLVTTGATRNDAVKHAHEIIDSLKFISE